jgi:hypothetical protein
MVSLPRSAPLSKQGCFVVKYDRIFLIGFLAISLPLACTGATVQATPASGGSGGGGGNAGGAGGDGGAGGQIVIINNIDAAVMVSGFDAGSPEPLPDHKWQRNARLF